MNKRINLVTTFSGYDSQTLAMHMLKEMHPDIDFNLVAWCEIDEAASKAHDLIFPEYEGRNVGDITKVDWQRVKDEMAQGEEIDLLTYSSPCQDISQAGKQMGLVAGSGTRSALLWNVVDAIVALKPKYLLQENVKALVSKKFMPDFEKWMEKLDELGYASKWAVINAKDMGVPQNRERVFCVSVRKDLARSGQNENGGYLFPAAIPLEKVLADVLEPEVDESYYLSDKAVAGFMKTSADFSHNHNFLPKRSDGPCTVRAAGQEGMGDDDVAFALRTKAGGRIDDNYMDESGESLLLTFPCRGGMQADALGFTAQDDAPMLVGETADEVNEEGVTASPRQLPEVVVGPSGRKFHLYLMPGKNEGEEIPMYLRLELRPTNVAEVKEQGEWDAERTVNVPLMMEYADGDASGTAAVMVMVDKESGVKRFACADKNVSVVELRFRIRKLTNRECFRLMGVQEWAIDRLMKTKTLPPCPLPLEGEGVVTPQMKKVHARQMKDYEKAKKDAGKLIISKTQLYKQAGNSIVVDVLAAIYEGLFCRESEMVYKRDAGLGTEYRPSANAEGTVGETSGKAEGTVAKMSKKKMREEAIKLQLCFEF